mmetsp:Transcript_56038/g.108147  ORF Transcript_56038/g.108147 Transcript_56038/m.108147 type:complete len:142 (-) Transcript_56038:12-437(-)
MWRAILRMGVLRLCRCRGHACTVSLVASAHYNCVQTWPSTFSPPLAAEDGDDATEIQDDAAHRFAELDLWQCLQPEHGERDVARWLEELDLWRSTLQKYVLTERNEAMKTALEMEDATKLLSLMSFFLRVAVVDFAKMRSY